MLAETEIRTLADVRSFPGSRRHPQYGRAPLAASLAQAGIVYVHLPELGGRRRSQPGSPNMGLRVVAFRAYADHMATAEFATGLERLEQLARGSRTAFLGAERLWWRCHRRMLADRLLVAGWDV